MTWHDQLHWAIRPDCCIEARDVLQRIEVNNEGLHRDNLHRQFSKEFAKWFNMDELPIDMAEGGIAVISVVGVLVNTFTPFTANYPALTAAFDRCATDPNVKAVVVRFKTPGGTVSGLYECAEALDQLSDHKLTVAQVDGGCYSAGVFLAVHCGTICCGHSDHFGNIGTVLNLWDYSEMVADMGIRSVTKKSGPIKGLGIMGDPITAVQEKFLEHTVQEHFANFRAAVMTGRDLSDEQFAAVSDGRWWLGREAVANGLIDRVSTLSETLDAVRKQLQPSI